MKNTNSVHAGFCSIVLMLSSMLPSCNANQSRISSPNPGPSPETPTIAFGKEAWEDYFGAVDEEPALPDNINEILNSDCLFWPGKKIKETHLLVMIPATANDKPFTLRQLRKLIKEPQKGHATGYESNGDSLIVRGRFGSTVFHNKKAYWILMTRNVVPSFSRRTASKNSYPEYAVPTILEATAAILTHYVRNREWIYEKTHTYCQEKIEKDTIFLGKSTTTNRLQFGYKMPTGIRFNEEIPNLPVAKRGQALLRRLY